MTTRSWKVLAVHRLLLKGSGPPLTLLWAAVYRLVARAWVAHLVRGNGGASTYLRGSLASGEVLPGLSDVDVAVVVNSRERSIARWQALRRRIPMADLLLDYPMIFEPEDLRNASSDSVLACRGTAYFGPRSTQDTVRLMERPGLYGATDGWRLMSGPDRLPATEPRSADARRVAAWLELVAWWGWVPPACADPRGPRTAGLCVKLIAEPVRIWLWLARGERATRLEALERGLELLPEEEAGLRLALELQASLRRSPEPPLAEVLPVLVRLSRRIATLLAQDAGNSGTTEVALAGAPVAGPLPLCDWRGLVQPSVREEWFDLASGDPGSPSDVARAADLYERGPLPALGTDDLMVFAAHRNRTRMRAVACPVTDPVSFALAAGRRSATFPEVPGWRAADVARRAVEEHRPLLAAAHTHGEALAGVLSAARAGLFAEGVTAGDPVLALTLTEAGRALAERAPAAAELAVEELAEFSTAGARPSARTVEGLRAAVRGLPAFQAPRAGSVARR